MRFAIAGTDDPNSFAIKDYAKLALSYIGFHLETVPVERLVEAIRMLSISGGNIDLVILHCNALKEQQASKNISQTITNAKQVINNIRQLDDSFCLQSSVKACSVPIVILFGDGLGEKLYDEFASMKWITLVPANYASSNYDLEAAAHDVICAWRSELIKELECVGYAVSITGDSDFRIESAYRVKQGEGAIIAQSVTFEELAQSRYLVLSNKIVEETQPCKALEFLMNNYREMAKKAKRKPEDLFQEFFERNPSFVLRGEFLRSWPKPRLKIPESANDFLEPDFLLEPRIGIYSSQRWEILDLKLPDVSLISQRSFHPRFSSKVLNAISQLKNYRSHFARPDLASDLKKRFGSIPINPKVAILIGSFNTSSDQEIIAELQYRDHLDIELITYDEILEDRYRSLAFESSVLARLTR